MTQRTFQRRVSDNEQFYVSMQELFSTFAINLVVQGEGSLDPVQLQNAVAEASEACPGARLILKDRLWVDSGLTPPVHFMPAGSFDGEHFSGIAGLESRMDPYLGPTCEVVVLQNDPTGLVFRALHAVMDGKGAKLWIENVFRAMRGEDLLPVIGTKNEFAFIEDKRPHDFRPNLKLSVRTTPGSPKEAPYRVWRKRITLPGQPAAMVARIAQVVTDLGISETNRFLIPVNLRRHEEHPSCSGNLTLPIFMDSRKGEGWATLHSKLLSALQSNQELNLKSANLGLLSRLPKWMVKLGLRAALGLQVFRNRQPCGAVISNLGWIELERFRAPGFVPTTLYSLTVQQPFIPIAIGVASNRNGTEVMISCYEGQALQDHACRILEVLQQSLALAAPIASPQGARVVELFLEQASLAPQAIALRWGDESLTYSEVRSHAACIAAELRIQDVRAGQFVAVCMQRGPRLMPSLLAIMSVGAVFVPIDPETSAARIVQMIQHSGSTLVLVDSRLCLESEAGFQASVVDVSRLELSTQKRVLKIDPLNGPLYQIYTSGSTGAPKGVQVGAGSLSNYLVWARETYGVDSAGTIPLFASIGFDSALTPMLLPLI